MTFIVTRIEFKETDGEVLTEDLVTTGPFPSYDHAGDWRQQDAESTGLEVGEAYPSAGYLIATAALPAVSLSVKSGQNHSKHRMKANRRRRSVHAC
jgi:hypothetical protein